MKGAPEFMRIFGFMHGVNNYELTKRLNEHIPKTMEEMMTATTAFIRGKTVAASKKKCHTSWKPQDHPKQHVSERRSDFRGQPREGRGSNKFTPLTRTPKEILAAEAGKFKLPPPMAAKIHLVYQDLQPFLSEEVAERLLALPTPPPSPLSPYSSPLPQIPSPPLPISSPPPISPTYVEGSLGSRAAGIRQRDALPVHETEIPEMWLTLRKRLCRTTPGPRCEVGE
ncbi:hypothetical protein Tco_0204401 [Tanacetum coccineum]